MKFLAGHNTRDLTDRQLWALCDATDLRLETVYLMTKRIGVIQIGRMIAVEAEGRLSRILVWWREVDWRTVGAYTATAVPFAALGAATLLVLPTRFIEAALGVFFISMIGLRRWMAARELKLRCVHLTLLGVPIGYLTGIVVSTGPLSVPLFLFYGLTKGAFLATEAASSLALFLSKSVTFQRFGALTSDVALKGLIAGSSLMFGAFIAKRFVLRLDPNVFRLVMDGIMIAAGLSLLWSAAFS